MKLTVRLFAALRERAGASEIVLDGLPDELDVAGLKREIARRYPDVGSLARVRAAVGTEYVDEARRLSSGDAVALIPPVSGGAPEAGSPDRGAPDHGAPGRGEQGRHPPDAAERLPSGVFELSQAALDPAQCLARVRDKACGAIATFTGTTRGTNRGREVVRLEYEAFDAMTSAEMGRIFARCRTEIATSPERALRMLVSHRVGIVEVGEPSVVIAVASPHRDAAFVACRFLIDELKRSMPIWKKEVYADGEEWIGERS